MSASTGRFCLSGGAAGSGLFGFFGFLLVAGLPHREVDPEILPAADGAGVDGDFRHAPEH